MIEYFADFLKKEGIPYVLDQLKDEYPNVYYELLYATQDRVEKELDEIKKVKCSSQ